MQIIYSDELVFYNKRFVFNKKWEYANFNLNSDGILTRVKGEKVKDWIDFKHVKLTVGKSTTSLKDRPPLHHWIDENLLLCISDKRAAVKKNWWLVFPDFEHLKKWLSNADLIIKAYESKRQALTLSENKIESTIDSFDPDEKDSSISSEKRPREREHKYTRVVEKPKDQIIHIYDDDRGLKKASNRDDTDMRINDGSHHSNASRNENFPRHYFKENNNSTERIEFEPNALPPSRYMEQVNDRMPPNDYMSKRPETRYPPPPPPDMPHVTHLKHENPQVTYIKHGKPAVQRIEYKSYDEFEEANRKYAEYEQDRVEYDRKRSSRRERSSGRHRNEPEPTAVQMQPQAVAPKASNLKDTSTDRIGTRDTNHSNKGSIRKNIQFRDEVEVRS